MVDERFPKPTSDCLKLPLDCKVSEIQYTIDLEGLLEDVFENISLGKHFYRILYESSKAIEVNYPAAIVYQGL